MQASARKSQANQRNAQSSTGAKTPAGKVCSAQNATKHGLSAGFTVLAHESQSEVDQLLEAYRKEFAPKSTQESDETNPDVLIVARLTEKCRDVLTLLNRYATAAERSYYRAHRELTQARSRAARNKANEAQLWLQQQLAPQGTAPI